MDATFVPWLWALVNWQVLAAIISACGCPRLLVASGSFGWNPEAGRRELDEHGAPKTVVSNGGGDGKMGPIPECPVLEMHMIERPSSTRPQLFR